MATKVKSATDDDVDEETARRQIVEICGDSLECLQTDYIDILQLHRDPPEPTMAVVMDTLADLKRQSKIRWTGISSNNAIAGEVGTISSLGIVQG